MYLSVQEFIARVGEKQAIELTDRENVYQVNTAVAEVALADATACIDGYLCARYTVPLVDVPLNIKRICCDITRFYLSSMSETRSTDEIKERFEMAIKQLEKLSAGDNSLGLDPGTGEEIATEDDTILFSNSGNRIFSRDIEDDSN